MSNAHQNKTVFQLNNEAITVLQQRKYSDAISKLQAAIVWMRNLVHDPTRSSFELLPVKGYGSQAENESIQDISILSVPADMESLELGSQMDMDNVGSPFEFFDMCFVTTFLDYQGTRGQRLTTSFVLYNLGLCFHRREITNATMKDENLRTALKFYGKALRIIDGAFDDGRYEDMTLLLLAIFNNMGYLHAYFGDMSDTRHCILWMRRLLSTHEAFMLGNSRSDFAFFYGNTLLVDNGFEKAAAA